MRTRTSGFTLVELMIVVAIVGILAAVALPAYNRYTARTKISEVLLAANDCRTSIAEIVQSQSVLPAAGGWSCETTTGATAKSRYVNTIETSAEGAVRVSIRGIGAEVDNQAIVLRPWPDVARSGVVGGGGTIALWDCGPDPANVLDISEFLPSSCRASGILIGPLTAFDTGSI